MSPAPMPEMMNLHYAWEWMVITMMMMMMMTAIVMPALVSRAYFLVNAQRTGDTGAPG